MLAVPAAKLYTREMNNAISLGIRKPESIPMTKDLKDEIINWRFLDSWTGKLEWKKERHLVVNIYTDASMNKWGGYLKINDNTKSAIHAFVVGNKGQRSVLKYPTKKGYVQDGFGLPEILWAIRIKGKPSVCINYGKLLFLNEPLVSNKFHLICIGDSMIRFLEWQKDFNNPMVNVSSQSGALVCEITPTVERLIRTHPPRLIFIHIGVNNVSKSFLFKNEFDQLLITTQEFEHLAQILQCTLESDRHVSVVLSAIIRCKDEAINAKSTIINEKIEKLCKRNCWMFMDNSNINCRHLRDREYLMKKIWCPYITCSRCAVTNDIDFKYCKACGFARENKATDYQDEIKKEEVLNKINNRISQLDALLDSASYSKQKCSLKNEMEKFFIFLDSRKNINNASPEDIRKFLIFKEKGGKTQLHVTNCPLRTKHGLQVCKCPRTLASTSIDSLLGKIRALFRDEGRSGEWNPMLLTGNPAASHLLKKHLQVINQEQANASISVKQATPLMFSKLGKLCRHLSYRVSVEVDPISKCLYARDMAYFSILCHSGSRGGDLGLLTADKCFQIPDSDGIFVSQTAGQVATLDNPRNFIVLPSKDSDICPVKNFKKYITNAKELSITLTEGYVFRIQDKGSRKIVNEPVTSSCMTERLKLHLNVLKLYEGETSHSSRRGCAITLRMLGVNDEAINQHVGWGTKHMVDHYANVGKLISPKGPASVLSQAAENLDKGNSSFDKVANQYTDLSKLKSFSFN
ncbi:unnamed protein product [Mytilus coruscus]|uniref:ALOG domain-containing protein n=1 Tax=Mytilus coruscus TaxID=42192 RepID=A0A6J8CHK2_MYTCO|nr:unnamed protein product [Mytilus coruscus]